MKKDITQYLGIYSDRYGEAFVCRLLLDYRIICHNETIATFHNIFDSGYDIKFFYITSEISPSKLTAYNIHSLFMRRL
jgi:hypothetical protein